MLYAAPLLYDVYGREILRSSRLLPGTRTFSYVILLFHVWRHEGLNGPIRALDYLVASIEYQSSSIEARGSTSFYRASG